MGDKISAPSYTLDLAEMLRPFVVDGGTNSRASGILHLANSGQCSWREYGQWALDCCRAEGMSLRAQTVGAISLADMQQFVARRPVYSVLATEKYARLTGRKPRVWRDAVRDYIRRYVVTR